MNVDTVIKKIYTRRRVHYALQNVVACRSPSGEVQNLEILSGRYENIENQKMFSVLDLVGNDTPCT